MGKTNRRRMGTVSNEGLESGSIERWEEWKWSTGCLNGVGVEEAVGIEVDAMR